jgi:hypothetical protein
MMNGRVNRDLVTQLLADETLSYREIGRRAGCSDWTVRAIAREATGDLRPMKSPQCFEGDGGSLGVAGWGILAGIIAAFGAAAWLGARNTRPP